MTVAVDANVRDADCPDAGSDWSALGDVAASVCLDLIQRRAAQRRCAHKFIVAGFGGSDEGGS